MSLGHLHTVTWGYCLVLVHTPCMCCVVSTLLAAGQISWPASLAGWVSWREEAGIGTRKLLVLSRRIKITKKNKEITRKYILENNKTSVVSIEIEKICI